MKFRQGVVIVLLRLLAVALSLFAIYYTYYAVQELTSGNYPNWSYVVMYIQLTIEAIAFLFSAFFIYSMSTSLFQEYDDLPKMVPETYPMLDVYITIRYVDVDILEDTVKGMVNQDYPKDRITIYLADDTPDEELSKKYRELCKTYGLKYIYDPTNVKYKAGMMNIAIPQGSGEYIAFFDYDQIPLPGILSRMVETLLAHPDAPFVQAKKKFHSLYNLSRVWSALLYVQYFEVLQLTKMELKTVLFAGSTAVFRRSSIEAIGGVPMETFTEDNEMSTLMMIQGMHGIYLNEYGSLGTVPYGFRAQIAQLWRWSHGGAHVLNAYGKSLLKTEKMNLSQKMDVISLIIITPMLLLLYTYVFSFYLLLTAGIDAPRLEVAGFSTLGLTLVGPLLTYALITVVALWRAKQASSEFSLWHLIGFMTIGLTANTLILPSGIMGLLGKRGPKSPKGKWTVPVPIVRMSIVAFVIACVMVISSWSYLMAGYSSAILLLLTGMSLLPTPFITMYYMKH